MERFWRQPIRFYLRETPGWFSHGDAFRHEMVTIKNKGRHPQCLLGKASFLPLSAISEKTMTFCASSFFILGFVLVLRLHLVFPEV
jgi:hypothetical protein